VLKEATALHLRASLLNCCLFSCCLLLAFFFLFWKQAVLFLVISCAGTFTPPPPLSLKLSVVLLLGVDKSEREAGRALQFCNLRKKRLVGMQIIYKLLWMML
jgi:hypothetical protein